MESDELGVWGERRGENDAQVLAFDFEAVGPFSESRMQEQKPSQMKKKVALGYSGFYYYLLI